MKHFKKTEDKVIKMADYLTVTQAAKESDRSEGSIRKRIQDGTLISFKAWNSVLIPKQEVERLKKRSKNPNWRVKSGEE